MIKFLFLLTISAPASANVSEHFKEYRIVSDTTPASLLYKSGFGQRKKVVLPDGTEVTLNSNSSVKLAADFGVRQRNILLKGDAYFNIPKYQNKSFIIRTAQLVMTTTKAGIKVNAYPDVSGEEALTLTGSVKVKKSYYSKLDNDEYVLGPGQMIMINRGIDLIEKEKFDSAQLKVWLQNKFILNNSGLNDFIKKIYDWFNVEISVEGKIPSDLTYTGTFTRPSLQSILNTVGKAWGSNTLLKRIMLFCNSDNINYRT